MFDKNGIICSKKAVTKDWAVDDDKFEAGVL